MSNLAQSALSDEQGRQLLAIARDAIAAELNASVNSSKSNLEKNNSAQNDSLHNDTKKIAIDKSVQWLQEPGACFVTLMQHGQLRGCIGSLEPRRSLVADVEANARAAAFYDPRFELLSVDEFEETDIEISLLSPTQPLTFIDEEDALAQLRPNIDGVLLECGHLRSTFLPQVWEQLPTPREFIAHLKVKAGLSADSWPDEIRLSRYTVAKFKEHSH